MPDTLPPSYFFVAGEPSGDQHAAALAAALRRCHPDAILSGVAGAAMRRQGVTPLFPAEELAVMGFSDVFRALPRLVRHFRTVRDAILRQQPSAVVTVDYPGFNLRLAKSLRRHGYQRPLIHYISPAVWAWGRHRIATMARYLDMLLTIYPFEKEHFAAASLSVEYVGNPVAEAMQMAPRRHLWRSELGIPTTQPLLGLFPGSRLHEVERNLPRMLDVVAPLGYTLAISAANAPCARACTAIIRHQAPHAYVVPREVAYFELMGECRAALAKSGTVTLELALARCPTVVTYHLTPLNRFIAGYLLRIRLPHYCIVNILAERDLFPEFIADPADTATVRMALAHLLADGERRDAALAGCDAVATLLSGAGTADRAATFVAALAMRTSPCAV